LKQDKIAARNQNNANELEKRASFPSVTGLKFDIDGSSAYFAGTNKSDAV
jgi:mannan endo-1,4-beta-mannosidase